MTTEAPSTLDSVGPVLRCGRVADAVVAAIEALNAEVVVHDRGAYLRVLVPQRCVVTRTAIEAQLGQPFRMPGDLEAILSAFKGRFRVDEEHAVWELGGGRAAK